MDSSRRQKRRRSRQFSRKTEVGHRPISRPGREKRRTKATSGIQKGTVQFVACGLIFVSLVGMKLLLPAHMEALGEKMSGLLHQNMDVQAVFSAVGRLAAGEASGADLARAVFGMDAMEIPAGKPVPIIVDSEPEAALKLLQGCGMREPEIETGEALSAEAAAAIQYSAENLPDCVSMEQEILGFSYCTPVRGALTSGFGYREHPVGGGQRFHYGIDLAAEEGTEIACFADGTVTAVGESSSYGKYCIVEHEGGFETLYAHCSRIAVTSGSAVRRGQTLGTVGDTGMATGVHLHFELHRDGIWLNPIYYVETV